MKKLLIPLAVTSLATTGFASEFDSFSSNNANTLHLNHFSPIFFYKWHREGKYNYEFSGVGIKYSRNKEKGLNFGLDILSNLDSEKAYIETESHIGLRFQTDFFHFLPCLMTKHITHQIDRNENLVTMVSKGTSYLGVGLSPNYDSFVKVELAGFIFRDLYNSILVLDGEKFHGLNFINPFGYRTDLTLKVNAGDNFVLETKGTFSQGFRKEYWEAGAQLSLSWRY